MGKIFSVKDNNSGVSDEVISRKQMSQGIHNYDDSSRRNRVVVDFSPRLMLFVLFILALLFYSGPLVSILLFLFFSFVIMSTVRPVVNWFVRKGIGKGWGIFISYFLLFIIIISFLALLSIPVATQFTALLKVLPSWVDTVLVFLEDFTIFGQSVDLSSASDFLNETIKGLPSASNVKNLANVVTSLFSFGTFFFLSIIFSIYLVSEHDSFFDILIIRIVSGEKRERVRKLVLDVESKLGSWVLGQAVVSLCVTIFSAIVLALLKVPFVFPLALLTGFLGVIPNLGSTIAGILMALVALISVGPIAALILLVAFILYQPLENSVITPRVMGNAVGLKPVLVLLGVVIFLTLFGAVGAFIAVPSVVIIKIFYEFYIDLQKLKAKGIV